MTTRETDADFAAAAERAEMAGRGGRGLFETLDAMREAAGDGYYVGYAPEREPIPDDAIHCGYWRHMGGEPAHALYIERR